MSPHGNGARSQRAPAPRSAPVVSVFAEMAERAQRGIKARLEAAPPTQVERRPLPPAEPPADLRPGETRYTAARMWVRGFDGRFTDVPRPPPGAFERSLRDARLEITEAPPVLTACRLAARTGAWPAWFVFMVGDPPDVCRELARKLAKSDPVCAGLPRCRCGVVATTARVYEICPPSRCPDCGVMAGVLAGACTECGAERGLR